MSIDFGSLLTTEQKRQLLEGRIAQFASEAFQYELNLKTANALGSDEDQVNKIKEAIGTLEAAIKIHQDELNSLPPVLLD